MTLNELIIELNRIKSYREKDGEETIKIKGAYGSETTNILGVEPEMTMEDGYHIVIFTDLMSG